MSNKLYDDHGCVKYAPPVLSIPPEHVEETLAAILRLLENDQPAVVTAMINKIFPQMKPVAPHGSIEHMNLSAQYTEQTELQDRIERIEEVQGIKNT